METWKTNLDETKKRYIDWWNHKGIILNMWEHFQEGVKPHADIPAPSPAKDLNQKWFDPQWRAEYLDWYVAHSSLKADILPVANTQLGPGSLAAILGGVFEGGEDTIWIHPDPDFNDEIVFNPEHPNWILHKELLKACKAKANGHYYVGMPDLMEGLDVLAALKGTPDDSQRTVKSILRELGISEKMFPPRTILSEISHAKDLLQEPDEYIASAAGDYRNLTIGKVYKHYQKKLKAANAMDFDDMICHTVKLFEQFPDVLDHYQNLYKYIMVDEYQDTNKAQFRLVSLLSQKFHNLCVVGDDDQSIYKFRGATIENILNFEEQFDCNADTDVIKLEQNYRSTQNILNCANQLISNNQGRKGKNLWTASGDGEKVTVYKASSERSEAKFVADTILEDINKGRKYNDHAILYRMNAQSNALEQTFIQSGIPYKIIGGLKFYDRKEIKDILAYLSVINNHFDFLRLRRIINEPKRGIGEATVNALEQITSDLGDSPIHIMQEADMLAPLVKRSKQLMPVGDMLSELTELSDTLPLAELLDKLLDMTGYKRHLEMQGDEGLTRLENINELKSTMSSYEENADEPSLSGFLEEISLYTDVDNLDSDADYVVLMTMHSAKGLEFPIVFVVGMEDNIFPSSRSLESEADTEEERRLAYVAVTRAKEKLYLTHAEERMLYGRTDRNRISRFIKELPADCIEKQAEETKASPYLNGYEKPHSMSLQQQLAQRKADKSNFSVNTETFAPGDRVLHKIFGEGTVLSSKPMANDTLVEIAFDNRGTKKIMANYTKIKKI